MGKLVGKDCDVKIGSASVKYMGNWALNGISVDKHDTTSFGDDWKQYNYGLKDGGQITFSGFRDPDDTTGQEALLEANLENTNITNIRLYVDNTSYYEPCQTTGYFSPNNTTGTSTQLSHVNVTAFNIQADQSGMVKIDFTADVSGVMVLV